MKTTTIGAFSVATAVMSITVGYLAKVDQLLLPDEELALEDRLSFAPGGREEYLKVKQGQREAVWDEEKGWYNFGRFTQPPRDASLHWLNPFQEYVQLKEWYWSSFSSGSVLVAVATMQLGYTSHGIMYYYDVATGETDKLDVELKFFGRTLGPTFLQKDGRPSSPVNGSTEFSFGSTNITQAYQAETHMLRAEANGFLVGGRKLSVSFEMDLGTDDTLSFVYPLGRRRPVIVTKGGAFEARATVRVDEKELLTRESGLGMIDWTRSMAARLTTWNWAAFSFVDAATGDRVGVHLSAGVYEDTDGTGLENGVFVNGVLTPLNMRVVFQKPEGELDAGPWHVSAGDSVSFTFTPRDSIHAELHMIVLEGDCYHMWGTMNGTVSVAGKIYQISNQPGVVEEHYALW